MSLYVPLADDDNRVFSDTYRVKNYSWVFEIEDQDLKYDVMAQLGLRDLYFFAKYILNMVNLETKTDIHSKLCGILDQNPARGLFLMFRGSFKTSLSIAKGIQILAKYPWVQIGYGSDKWFRARDRTRDMRNLIAESELLHLLYPQVFYENPENESDKWTEEKFNIRRPPRHLRPGGFEVASVNAFGLDPLPTGSHYDVVIIDDIENEENAADEDQITKLTRSLKGFIPVLKAGCPLWMFGTPYSSIGPNTSYQSKWGTYKRSIIDKHRQPTFPSKYDWKEIEKRKRDIDDDFIWESQYMMKSIDKTDEHFFPFSDSKFQYFRRKGKQIFYKDGMVNLDECKIYMTVDPGGGASEQQATKKTDKVGWCINAVTPEPVRWFFLDRGEKHMDDPAFVQFLYEKYAAWHPAIIGIEKMPHLDQYLREHMVKMGWSLPLVELKPKKRKKENRIRALKPLLGIIYFDEADKSVEFSYKGWYTEQKHGDDGKDADAYQIDIARPPTKTELVQLATERAQTDLEETLSKLSPKQRAEYEYHTKPLLRKQGNSQEVTHEEMAEEFNEFLYPGDIEYCLDEYGLD